MYDSAMSGGTPSMPAKEEDGDGSNASPHPATSEGAHMFVLTWLHIRSMCI